MKVKQNRPQPVFQKYTEYVVSLGVSGVMLPVLQQVSINVLALSQAGSVSTIQKQLEV